jgi:hypothetical protein
MKLTAIAKRFLRFEVGNGESIHLWLDWWHPSRILIEQMVLGLFMMLIVILKPNFPQLYVMGIGFGDQPSQKL